MAILPDTDFVGRLLVGSAYGYAAPMIMFDSLVLDTGATENVASMAVYEAIADYYKKDISHDSAVFKVQGGGTIKSAVSAHVNLHFQDIRGNLAVIALMTHFIPGHGPFLLAGKECSKINLQPMGGESSVTIRDHEIPIAYSGKFWKLPCYNGSKHCPSQHDAYVISPVPCQVPALFSHDIVPVTAAPLSKQEIMQFHPPWDIRQHDACGIH